MRSRGSIFLRQVKAYTLPPRDGKFNQSTIYQRWFEDESAYPAFTILGIFTVMCGAFGYQYLRDDPNVKGNEDFKHQPFRGNLEDIKNKPEWKD